MAPRLDGKVVLITGTGGGQGRAGALAFHGAGAIVHGCDLDATAHGETVRMVDAAGGTMTGGAPVDLADPDAAAGWVADAVATHGRIDVVYNNASAARFGAVDEMSVDDWRFTMRNELDLVFFVTRAAWAHLGVRGGVVLNTASIAGLTGSSKHPTLAHSTAKGGVIAMTRQMAVEGARLGIRALSISPGPIVTPGTADLFADPTVYDLFAADTAVKRLGVPADIAGVAVFLASDEAAFMTGTDVVVDGGATAFSV